MVNNYNRHVSRLYLRPIMWDFRSQVFCFFFFLLVQWPIISCWAPHPSAGLTTGFWINLHQVRHTETFPTLPPLPFSVFLSYPASFSPIRFVAALLSFFLSTSIIFPFSLDCCPPFPSGTITLPCSSLPFPPSRVMAVKQARAHGRPLTGRPSESELSCRNKRLQTLAHKHL